INTSVDSPADNCTGSQCFTKEEKKKDVLSASNPKCRYRLITSRLCQRLPSNREWPHLKALSTQHLPGLWNLLSLERES
ncbi:hypothetical protein HispidOSU_029434, partial [Sigmodon hispidus]